MTGRTRASSIDVSTGFKAAGREPIDTAALDKLGSETPFKSRAAAADPVEAKRGRPSRGPKTTVYARLPAAKYERLQRIREEMGWPLVTALERAVDALGEREGVD